MRRLLIIGFGDTRTGHRVAALAKGGSLPQRFVNHRLKQALRPKLDDPAALHGISAAAQKHG